MSDERVRALQAHMRHPTTAPPVAGCPFCRERAAPKIDWARCAHCGTDIYRENAGPWRHLHLASAYPARRHEHEPEPEREASDGPW